MPRHDSPSGGPRSLWKGAISFGLVHIPVTLHSATRESGIDFDWLDKRTMDPVGYRRINKRTGQEIEKENIVKGVAYASGEYVVLGDEELAAVYPKSTQTIAIEAFVGAAEIPFVHLDRPYYLAPQPRGEKVYALLREALLATQRIGLARMVMSGKQHLCALVPSGPALVLDLLRWGADIRDWSGLPLPEEGAKANGIAAKELDMAVKLVEDLSAPFDPQAYTDSFRDEVMALVETKVQAGQTHTVMPAGEAAAAPRGAEVIDLSELLRRSLRGGKEAQADDAAADRKPKPARKRA